MMETLPRELHEIARCCLQRQLPQLSDVLGVFAIDYRKPELLALL